jgi:peptide/nickel transport system permease protein
MKNIYQFIAVRFGLSIITLLLISFIVFSLMELVPGNCAERYLSFKQSSGQNITFQDIAAEERRLGLDRPFLIRYSSWVLNAFQGDFGTSCIMRVDISTLLIPKFGSAKPR